MSKICTIPISELSKLTSIYTEENRDHIEQETFIIPDYQRGYRWEAEIHISALLNDVFDFMNMSRKTDDRYCLQPIVVSRSAVKNDAWEVIDGQQRLTTLYLLLRALGLDAFNLEFETRSLTNDFLKKLIEENEEDHNRPDFHFMSDAWRKINNWIGEHKKHKLKYAATLLENVHVIWYDIESSSRETNIDVFNRLNIGKIALTDAELVKALILTKIKGKYSGQELALRQSEISNEWHRMEIELQKPRKWEFLTANSQSDYESHLDLIFNLLAESDESKNYSTYLWFEKQVLSVGNNPEQQADEALRLWQSIRHAFACVNSWFCDATPDTTPTIYHYVGYLLATRKSKLRELYADSKFNGKSMFTKKLRDRILEYVNHINLDELNYEESNSSDIKNILLLFNVLTCESIADGIYNRFPFDRYNAIEKERKGSSGWSLEHIFAQKSQDPMKNPKAVKGWIHETLMAIENIDTVTRTVQVQDDEDVPRVEEEPISLVSMKERLREIETIPNKDIDIDEFNDIKNKINDLFGMAPMHDLSNLALLSTTDNSSLNNSIFPVKRNLIIDLEKKGRFIPPCTRNAFLKFYSPADSQPFYWGRDDQTAYFNAIIEVINSFKA